MKRLIALLASFLAILNFGVHSIELEQLPGDILASSLPSSRGYAIYGASQSNHGQLSGKSIKFVGDVNKDGYGDYLVGAWYGTYLTRQYCGISYLLFGGSNINPSDIDLASLTSSTGYRVLGASGNDFSGNAVAGGLDINNDGYTDFIIGAYNSNPTISGVTRSYAGTTYVIYGKANRNSDIDLASLSSSDGFLIAGANQSDYSGRSVSRAGDVNGDGYEDIIIGADMATKLGRPRSGAAYVVYGGTSLTRTDLSNLPSNKGFAIIGPSAEAYAGYAVSNAGDFNNDGVADVLVGAYGAGSSIQGVVYIIFGKKSPAFSTIDLNSFTTSQGITITGKNSGDQFGFSLSYAGDFNGDKIDDIIVGANYVDQGSVGNGGAAYIIYGKKSISSNFSVSDFPNSQGFDIYGMGTNYNFGFAVSGGADIDKDGYSDVVVGANQQTVSSKTNVGVAYVIAGKPSITSSLYTASFSTSDGFIITGNATGDFFGSAVDLSGDITGDGYADVLVSAPQSSPKSRSNAGSTYVFIGGDFTPSASPTYMPTAIPTQIPTYVPTATPTYSPSATPSEIPTPNPTASPTFVPSAIPTVIPTYSPTPDPTFVPSQIPTTTPSSPPTYIPTALPTTAMPSEAPTYQPSAIPTTATPSALPTPWSAEPTHAPTATPTFNPTARPTNAPTLNTKAQVSFNLFFNFSSVKASQLSSAGITALELTFQSITGLPLDNIGVVSLLKATPDPIDSQLLLLQKQKQQQLQLMRSLRRQLQILSSGYYTLLFEMAFKINLNTNPTAVESNNINGLCNDYKDLVANAIQDGTFTTLIQQYGLQFQASELYDAQTTSSTTASTSPCTIVNNGTDSNAGTNSGGTKTASVSDSVIAAIVIVIVFFLVVLFCCFYVGIAYFRKKNEERIIYQERHNQSIYSGINTSGEEFEMGDNTVMMFLSSDDPEQEADSFGFVPRKRISQVTPAKVFSDEEDEEDGDEEEGEDKEDDYDEEEDHRNVLVTIMEEDEEEEDEEEENQNIYREEEEPEISFADTYDAYD